MFVVTAVLICIVILSGFNYSYGISSHHHDNQFFNLKILSCFVRSSLYCPRLGLFIRERNILINCGSKNLGAPRQAYNVAFLGFKRFFLLMRVICLVVL